MQIQSATWEPLSVRLIGSLEWEKNEDPITNVEIARFEADWERHVREKCRSAPKHH